MRGGRSAAPRPGRPRRRALAPHRLRAPPRSVAAPPAPRSAAGRAHRHNPSRCRAGRPPRLGPWLTVPPSSWSPHPGSTTRLCGGSTPVTGRNGGPMELFGSHRFLFDISPVSPTAPLNDASVLERPNVKHLSATASGGPVGRRYVIEDIYPSLEGGRFPVKRIAGEPVDVWADIFRDGHEVAVAALCWRGQADPVWHRVPMRHHGNDRWVATMTDRKSTRLNSSHGYISYAVFCLKKKKKK